MARVGPADVRLINLGDPRILSDCRPSPETVPVGLVIPLTPRHSERMSDARTKADTALVSCDGCGEEFRVPVGRVAATGTNFRCPSCSAAVFVVSSDDGLMVRPTPRPRSGSHETASVRTASGSVRTAASGSREAVRTASGSVRTVASGSRQTAATRRASGSVRTTSGSSPVATRDTRSGSVRTVDSGPERQTGARTAVGEAALSMSGESTAPYPSTSSEGPRGARTTGSGRTGSHRAVKAARRTGNQSKAPKVAPGERGGGKRKVGNRVLLLAGALVLVVASVAAARSMGPSSEIPDTPVGDQLGWVLDTLNGGIARESVASISGRFAPSALGSVSGANLMAQLGYWADRHVGYRYTRSEGRPSRTHLSSIVVTATMEFGLIEIQTEPEEPYRIVRFRIQPTEPDG